jgi:hypothetical protein
VYNFLHVFSKAEAQLDHLFFVIRSIITKFAYKNALHVPGAPQHVPGAPQHVPGAPQLAHQPLATPKAIAKIVRQ